MKNIIIYIILFIIIFSCQSMIYKGMDQKEKLENQIIFKTAQQLKKEKNLIPAGFGGSDIEGKEFLEISFNYFEPLSIEKSRELVVYSAQVFLDNLNKNESLKNLVKKSYTMGNVAIEIFCYMPDYSNPQPPKIGLVDFRRNIISYQYNKEHFETIYEETYEEAVEKLKKEENKSK